MIYRDPIIRKLIETFNAEGPRELRNRYFYGDPLIVPKSHLPACFITKDTTAIRDLTNAEDESRVSLVLNVVLDMTRDFNQAFDNISSANTVYEVLEGRGDDYQLLPSSIAYLLRKHQQLDSQLWITIDDALTIDYGIGVEKRGPGMYTVEGVMRFQIVHHQLRSGIGG